MDQAHKNIFKLLKPVDLLQLEDVVDFAFKHLSDIKRRTGENYAEHGLKVAVTLSELSSDPLLLRVAVLHDIYLHPDAKNLLKNSPLTSEEQSLAFQMHQLRRLVIDEKNQDLDKFINSFIQDERLFPLRMAHRLADIRQLDNFEPKLRKQIARETLHMYAAIAGRLGMHAWRYEMEDACFRQINPLVARKLESEFARCKVFDEECLNASATFLQKKLFIEGLHCDLQKRVKPLYSTYRKMILKRRSFDELTDRLALRVIVSDYMDCYRALGIIHKFMHPIPGKLKDYIGAPKENSYQSIHTVVYPLVGVTQLPVEIQIRTKNMNDVCEYGPAAHADYKRSKYAISTGEARVQLLKNIAHLRREATTPKQFERALRKYFDGEHLSIFDPDDHLYHLKKPATALDFVCHAYPNKYKKLKALRVNGRNAPMDLPLKDGDVVRAEFGRKVTFKPDWVRFSLSPPVLKQIEEGHGGLVHKNK